MGFKRKSSSPDSPPNPSKAAKGDLVSIPVSSWKPNISALTDIESWSSVQLHQDDTSSDLKENPKEDNITVQSSTPVSSPLQSEEDAELGLVITVDNNRSEEYEFLTKWNERKKNRNKEEGETPQKNSNEVNAEVQPNDEEVSDEELRKLDRDLMLKSKKLKLSSVNVRNIIHEVVTNEHVVAMMKAAIRDTQDMPLFEPKMTRSKLKEVVEKGVGMGSWNLSPIKKPNEIKPPQFVDIPLEDEEDSSDEEYCPDEDEEDETAEETFLESDVDSTASSPRGCRQHSSWTPPRGDESSCSPRLKPRILRHLSVDTVPMGPPAPPPVRLLRTTDPFIEKLHAVDKELELSPLSMEPYQVLTGGGGGGGGGGETDDSLVACRTRSKRPLRDVPLDQLEAELEAPDITPDMYDCVSTPEDREWTQWLQGLMSSRLDNEEEADEDDDPEYNFLDDLDEPDLEDYRNDRAVRITKKEISELMDELFETFHDELAVNEQHEEDHEESDQKPNDAPQFNVPQAIRFEEPLAHMLTACRQTVREKLDALQQRRENQARTPQHSPSSGIVLVQPGCPLVVMPAQRIQLQQQIQQHVQLLTQVNMLTSPVAALQSESQTSKHFLGELLSFAEKAEEGRVSINQSFKSIFRVCNLQPSLSLLEELKESPSVNLPPKPIRPHPACPFPFLPAGLAWLFATRSVFLYPELLPTCSLDPALHPKRSKNCYAKGEDGLLVLGLKHFDQTEFPYHLISHYLLRPKRQEQLRARVKDMVSSTKSPQNIIKYFCQNGVVPPLPVMCKPVFPGEECPPVEREQDVLPCWLTKSLPSIHKTVCQKNSDTNPTSKFSSLSFPKGTRYPKFLPNGIYLRLHPSKNQSHPSKPKSRALGAFSRPKLAPLAKAPPCPTAVSANGLFILTPAPSTPRNTAFPLIQPSITPSHGTVPLNTPINFRFLTPQLGASNPTHPPASLPPTLVHIPQCDTSALTTRTHRKQQMFDNRKKQNMPRKLAPLKPAPQMPSLLPLSCGTFGNMSNPVVFTDQPSTMGSTPCFQKENIMVIRAPDHAITPSPATSSSQDLIVQLVHKRETLSASSAAPAVDTSQLVLFQTISPTGPPQLLLLPQNALPLNQPTGRPEEGTSTAVDSMEKIMMPLNVISTAPSLLIEREDDGDAVKEKDDCMVGDRWEEEMAGALFGSPLLALSESSCSPEASVKLEVDECRPAKTGSCRQEALVEHKLSSGDGEEQQAGTGEKNSSENKERGSAEEGESGGEGVPEEDDGGENNSDEEGAGKRDGNGDKGREDKEGDGEKDGDGERDEEEEDFDDLTQDEDEEEVMSSASEESVLSVPELQETMEKLTWLATERRLGREGDSEEDNSPISPTSPNSQNSPVSQNSQEENSEDEDDGAMKVDELEAGDGEGDKLPEGDAATGEEPPQISGRGASRGRGRGRPPPRSMKRGRRQERGSKDTSKLLLLYDEHILDNDPMREGKDMAFAQAYLSRVREVLQELPGKVEEFLGLLYDFEQAEEGRSVVELFSQLKLLLRDWPELLKDFAAFLLPEQALECGLFEEQQAFERSRRFLRQLEISFGENPSHYQKIVKALQSGSPLSPAGIEELKSQMAMLLKGHTHLQGEFGMFFDEMRPPPARPGQFEEGVWPEDAVSGGDGEAVLSMTSRVGGIWTGFEEVTLPDLEEDEEPHKIRQINSNNRRRKGMLTHGNFKDCDWPEKDCSCSCHDSGPDVKHRRHKRKECLHCHGNKAANGSKVMKSQDSTFPSVDAHSERVGEGRGVEPGQVEVGEEKERDVKDDAGSGANSPRHDGELPVWQRPDGLPALIPEEQQLHKEEEKKQSQQTPPEKQSLEEEGAAESIEPSAFGPASDISVCAKNISLTPSGERVVLWTREADRVILTACQQQGANQSTFQAVSQQLGNKTAVEVSRRFRDLMHLFHTAASQASSEDEAAEHQSATDEEQD